MGKVTSLGNPLVMRSDPTRPQMPQFDNSSDPLASRSAQLNCDLKIPARLSTISALSFCFPATPILPRLSAPAILPLPPQSP